MAVKSGDGVKGNPGENEPLLGGVLIRDERDDGSSETLLDAQRESDDDAEDTDKPNQQVGTSRGVFIILSLYGLIFLQAANMSGITTIQSKVAEDLDAYAEASWFASAYLVGSLLLLPCKY